jgi:hypothetical protein
MLIRCHRPDLAAALAATDLPDAGLVFVAAAELSGWPQVLDELTDAFRLCKEAAAVPAPVVFVVGNDALLGRSGAEGAMTACGLLSAARTLALELARSGTPVNTVAVEADSDPATVAGWIKALLGPGAPTGELVHLGPGHLGKALA